MAITVLQTPTTPFDMAYGANPITLGGIDTIASADKYALRITIIGQTDPITDIRQTPNKQGRAIFDVQNALQAYVGPMQNKIDSLHYTGGFVAQNTRMTLAGETLLEYQKYRGMGSRQHAIKCVALSSSFTEKPWLQQIKMAASLSKRGVKKVQNVV